MELSENPWQVDNLQAFWFLCCPECVYRSKEETSFQIHAIQNHPLSSEFFSGGKQDPLNVTPIKEEPNEDNIIEHEVGECEAFENAIFIKEEKDEKEDMDIFIKECPMDLSLIHI